jgi:hypothetical protein
MVAANPTPTSALDDGDLLTPQARRTLLDNEIAAMLGTSFSLKSRFNHHAVLCSPTARVEVFIDEYGRALWS